MKRINRDQSSLFSRVDSRRKGTCVREKMENSVRVQRGALESVDGIEKENAEKNERKAKKRKKKTGNFAARERVCTHTRTLL